MAESDLHRDIIFYLIHLLQRFFNGQQVYISGNLLVYYEEGNPRRSVAPDCFVVRGVEARRRLSYRIWEEGKAPEVVFEISSRSTQREDLGKKMRLYAQLGVQEYFLYDPTGDYLDPPLAAFELRGEGYVPMEPVAGEDVPLAERLLDPDAGTPPEYESKILDLRLMLDEDRQLRLYDIQTGEKLLTAEEELARLRQQS